MHRRQSKVGVFGTKMNSLSFFQPIHTASITSKTRQLPLTRSHGFTSVIPTRAFSSSNQEDENEALAVDEVEPIEAIEEALEEALESLSSLSEQEAVLDDGEKTKKPGSRGKDKITGVSRGSDVKAALDKRAGAEPLSPVDSAIAGLFKTEEYLKEIMEEEQILYN